MYGQGPGKDRGRTDGLTKGRSKGVMAQRMHQYRGPPTDLKEDRLVLYLKKYSKK